MTIDHLAMLIKELEAKGVIQPGSIPTGKRGRAAAQQRRSDAHSNQGPEMGGLDSSGGFSSMDSDGGLDGSRSRARGRHVEVIAPVNPFAERAAKHEGDDGGGIGLDSSAHSAHTYASSTEGGSFNSHGTGQQDSSSTYDVQVRVRVQANHTASRKQHATTLTHTSPPAPCPSLYKQVSQISHMEVAAHGGGHKYPMRTPRLRGARVTHTPIDQIQAWWDVKAAEYHQLEPA